MKLIAFLLLAGLIILTLQVDRTPVYSGNVDTEVDLIRVKNGLEPLNEDEKLSKIAMLKCLDMVELEYFSHNTPDGQKIWETYRLDMFSMAGENLAIGYTSAKDTVKGWVNSPTHLENLVNPIYTEVGYGVCQTKENRFIVVQVLKG